MLRALDKAPAFGAVVKGRESMPRATENLKQPVVDIWVKRVPTIPLPEPI
jgi:hypothetical protein